MTIQKDPEGTETLHLAKIADIAGHSVLEIGSGDGRLTWRYAHTARLVVGLDPDAEALITAHKDLPHDLRTTVSFTRASSLQLPFPDETFDRAILAWSF